MPSIRSRSLAAAAAVIAALMVTTTACDSKKDDGASAQSSASAQADQANKADQGVDTGSDDGSVSLGGYKLPAGIPTDLSGDALDKWKNGGWKDYSDWASKAEDFANPYIENFWTPEQMARAKAEIPVAQAGSTSSGSGSGATSYLPDGKVKRKAATKVKATYHHYAPPVGKLFFSSPEGNMVCSAAVVTDPAHPGKSNLVWTAGHCVHAGKGGGWYRNIAFVPSFNNGAKLSNSQITDPRAKSVSPYGVWWANWATTSSQWIKGGGHQGNSASAYDYAVLHVKPESGKKSLQEQLGSALPVWFNAPAANKVKSMKVRGYPAESPYDGSKMYDCRGATKRFVLASNVPAQFMIGCTMNGGASGGPWFMTHNGRTYLVSNNSLSDRKTFITGPRLGKNAKQVYLATSRKFK
ncbi:trypsin-like serine peptidase [Streptomyces sp. NPDC058246]|uniref:trypsin-like serine peptidase n=1 Tax=unclassified Streptomyces TaxID=2593676 RepID=UPI00365D2FDB